MFLISQELNSLNEAREVARRKAANKAHGKALSSVAGYLDELGSSCELPKSTAAIASHSQEQAEASDMAAVGIQDSESHRMPAKSIATRKAANVDPKSLFEKLRTKAMLENAPAASEARHLSKPGSARKTKNKVDESFHSFMSA